MTLQQFDNWVIVESPNSSHYRVLAGSSGGYLHGSSWKLNSGVVAVGYTSPHLYFEGSSGSVYKLHEDSEIVRMNIAPTLAQLIDLGWKRVEGKDWINFDWKIDKNKA
jgi:hypothetical protein